MGLSRNKVAVPEGAAGTPPFWSDDSWIKDVVGAIKLKQYFKVRNRDPFRLLYYGTCLGDRLGWERSCITCGMPSVRPRHSPLRTLRTSG